MENLDVQYLVWSHEHGAWWRPKSNGYTIDMRQAGRYSREEAIKICRGRDQNPGKPLPELPVREDDALRCVWSPPAAAVTELQDRT